MAAIRGSTGPTVGASSLAWPAGTAERDYAILWDDDREARPDGWSDITHKVWGKRLSAADIAAALPVVGSLSALLVVSSAGGVGRVRWSRYCSTSAAGVAVWLGWLSPHQSGALASATYRRGSETTDTDGWRHAAFMRATASAGTYDPGSVHSRSEWISVEILPVSAPLAPVWLTTSGQPVDRAQAVPLSLQHESPAGSDMDRFRVEIRVAAGSWQHLAADGTIVGTSQELVGSEPRISIAAGQLTNNTVYEIRGYTHDEGGWSPASDSLTLTARTAPTLSVTLTTAAGDLSPSVSWTPTLGVAPQTSWEARVAPAGLGPDSAPAEWRSGPQAGTAGSWQAAAWAGATNGGSYVAWVRVKDGALYSAWTASSAQAVSWTPPPAPATIVLIDATPLEVQVGGVPATSLALDLQWQVDGEWTALTTVDGPASAVTVRVPLAPYDVARACRVRSVESVDGVRLGSAWVTSTAVASSDTATYLVSEDGTEWVAVEVSDAGVPQPVQGVAVFRGLGATEERVVRTPVAARRGWHEVVTGTQAARELLLGWLTSGERFWLRPTPERPLGGGLVDVPAVLVSAYEVPSVERVASTNTSGARVRFAWTTGA